MPQDRYPLAMRIATALLFVAVVNFTLTACVLQVARTDLDPITLPLSAYLKGPWGAWLRSAYYVMALALAGLAWASYQATRADLRSGLASVLFFIAALALPIVAVTPVYEHGAQHDLARLIHLQTAQTTFLCLCVGMLALSMRWRRDPRLREGSGMGLVVACLAFIQLWVLALLKLMPTGITQKILISLILLWLGWATLQLHRVQQAQPAPSS
ncbi:DUF998 domain-containing protein [Dyella sp. C9]|uniref:DUF998 domain-containing protein n=1 Tax=Dyella sp. C9 TaxID=2202154 RepID=UPI000DEFA7F6|nr:DUF998 domain-containing protein [Dyella sp. C9]